MKGETLKRELEVTLLVIAIMVVMMIPAAFIHAQTKLPEAAPSSIPQPVPLTNEKLMATIGSQQVQIGAQSDYITALRATIDQQDAKIKAIQDAATAAAAKPPDCSAAVKSDSKKGG